MPKPITNISQELFAFLKDRFELGPSVDEDGKSTTNPEDMKVFTFDFVTSKGEDLGCLVCSLLDDSESSNSLKVYFGQEISDAGPDTQDDWFKFLKEIRMFAKMHILGFDVRNLNKSRITKRDIEPMFESSFGPIDGSVKTSRQPLDGMEIIIKHSDRVDPKKKNSRSRKILKIYLKNDRGEKFLLPFKSLLAARAVARHINAGGTPYDEVGRNICQLVEEMMSLNRFVRTMKNTEFQDSRAVSAINSARDRYLQIKKQLASLSSQGGYQKNQPLLQGNVGELEDEEEYNDLFNGVELDEDNQLALPHVIRAWRNNPAIPEQEEFEKWATTSKKGPAPGEQMLVDDNSEKAKLTKLLAGLQNELKKLIHGRSGVPALMNPIKQKIQRVEQRLSMITEADAPAGGGNESPLTFPQSAVPNHFHSKREIEKMKDTSGKQSPLSLLNSKEDDKELQRITQLAQGRPLYREKINDGNLVS